MKVTVLNGSPKGRYSTTLHSILYLQKRYPDDEFRIVEVASRIRSLEKDFSPVLEALRDADLILFSYPVYTFIAPYQLHRGIELLKEYQGKAGAPALAGRYATQITTSKHFYDMTAHAFIEENARDLGLQVLRGFPADMDDLLSEKGREELTAWWDYLRFRIREADGKAGQPGKPEQSGRPELSAMPEAPGTGRNGVPDIALVTDCAPEDTALQEMIDAFRKHCPHPVRIVNLRDFPFKGGCISCFNCASDGTCIYTDGFADFLREQIYSASALIYAFTVRDHSMGSRFKCYDDRQFCNGHRMMTIGMPVGYLVNGDLDREPNLRTILEARAQVGRNFLCRIATRPEGDEAVRELVRELEYALAHRILLPQNFWGVGGTKIFRDLIWLMRGLMRADHRFYKAHGIYDDFPQRHLGKMLQIKLIGLLFNHPKIRKRMGGKMNEGMIAPYRRVL